MTRHDAAEFATGITLGITPPASAIASMSYRFGWAGFWVALICILTVPLGAFLFALFLSMSLGREIERIA